MDCREFVDLCSHFKATYRKYCYDAMATVNQCVSTNTSPSSLKIPGVTNKVHWNVSQFINTYGEELRDLRSCLATTGDSTDAQLTTIGSYFEQTWPRYPHTLLSTLNSILFGTPVPVSLILGDFTPFKSSVC